MVASAHAPAAQQQPGGSPMNRSKLVVAAALLLGAATAFAQQPPIPQYGPNITQEQARKAMAAAEAEARAKGWPMAIAIVDTAGQLVMFQRSDNTQSGSIAIAQDKAVSAAMFKRPSKAFQDGVAGGGAGLRLIGLRNASMLEGGLPIYVEGKIVGAIGASGMASDQDAVIAKAGADSLAK
jgi:uncharacterized protein GlcG (DUF336 family)